MAAAPRNFVQRMLTKCILLGLAVSASAFMTAPAGIAARRGLPAISTSRPLSLRGGSAVKMVGFADKSVDESSHHHSVARRGHTLATYPQYGMYDLKEAYSRESVAC